MKSLNLPVSIEDKIYQIQTDSNNTVLKIVSYFPLSGDEKQLIVNSIKNNTTLFDGFRSIFSDQITTQEWDAAKLQIKKRFQDELINID
jgi:hypothetical protein